jgi:DNA primase
MSLLSFIKKCHGNLVDNISNPEVIIAREYLQSRNVLDSSIKSVIIGYCNSDANLPDSVKHFGEEYRKEDNGKWDMSSYLRGRLIVPVFSEFNEIVGLATRKPSAEKGNTWWNLPNPFKKGNHLFLLNQAKRSIFETNKVYLVEGYMDAIVLHQYGLKNVVSLMGTALTSRKVSLIARYCNNVCLCFDTDENQAGQKASDLSISILKKTNFCETISIIRLPVKEDPDIYISENGLQSFLDKEIILKDDEIERICRETIKRKNTKEIINAQ